MSVSRDTRLLEGGAQRGAEAPRSPPEGLLGGRRWGDPSQAVTAAGRLGELAETVWGGGV